MNLRRAQRFAHALFIALAAGCAGGTRPVVTRESPVVIYGTHWCDGARQAAAYFDAHGVAYVLRDVDHDDAALLEMERAATRAGLPVGRCPLLDIGGHVVLGFERGRIERILSGRE